ERSQLRHQDYRDIPKDESAPHLNRMVLGRFVPRASIARYAWRRRSVLRRSCRRIRRYSCSFPSRGERLATGWYQVQSRQDGLVPADWPQEKKIALAIRYRHWHEAPGAGRKWLKGLTRRDRAFAWGCQSRCLSNAGRSPRPATGCLP